MAHPKLTPPDRCTHPRPHAEVIVRHFPQIKRHIAVVRLTCPQCGTPFAFIGPSAAGAEGYSLSEPVVDESRLELRAPLEPEPWRSQTAGLIFPAKA